MTQHAYRGVWAIVVCGLAAMGCKETVEGKYLDTEGIALVADVTSKDGKKAEVEISFLSGGDESNTYVDLADDKVTVTGDGKGKVVSAKSRGEYATSFDITKADAEFSIALDRKDADKKDAKNTSGTLPTDFSVSVDAAGDLSRKDDDLVIQWSPRGTASSVRIDIEGDCVFFTYEDGLPDDGEFVVPAGELFVTEASNADKGDCEATVIVTRTNKGKVDGVFDSESKLRLHQVRSTKFSSVE